MTKAIEAAARALWDRKEQISWEGSGLPTREWGHAESTSKFLCRDYAQAAIIAYLAAMKAEGFVMVPVEATDKICEAGLFANDNALLMGADCTDMRNAYRAMIAARPST